MVVNLSLNSIVACCILEVKHSMESRLALTVIAVKRPRCCSSEQDSTAPLVGVPCCTAASGSRHVPRQTAIGGGPIGQMSILECDVIRSASLVCAYY